ncbi:hypothetical protein BD779DRAFT_1677998 [Infundibulicybe gibba]|nr:hypothetical protein BD779DRAFT_1677998 [Infundibulicybe gibba]
MNANLSVYDARDIHLSSYILTFALIFFYYDHSITIDREIKYLWMRPKKPSTYWFLSNRYFLFSVDIVIALFEFTPFKFLKVGPTPTHSAGNVQLNRLPAQSCKSYELFKQVSIAANQFLVSVLMTLRVYALYGCSSRVLVNMAITGAAVSSVACWALFSGQNTTVSQQSFGCHTGLSQDTSTRLATAWEALFAYDSIVFALTLMKTWRAGRNIQVRARRLPIITLLLRDGAIYFAVMALSNLANILTFYVFLRSMIIVSEAFIQLFTNTHQPFLRGGLSEFSSSISVTMMSRFMLNLHETANAGLLSTQISTSDHLSRLEFAENPAESGLYEDSCCAVDGRSSLP